MTASWYRWQQADLVLRCHLQPGASADGFSGIHGDRLKIRVAAPPIDGRANSRLIAFLSSAFGVAQRNVTVEQGDSSRQKTVRISEPRRLPEELAIQPS